MVLSPDFLSFTCHNNYCSQERVELHVVEVDLTLVVGFFVLETESRVYNETLSLINHTGTRDLIDY
jgi:hypothetical protein